MRILVAYGSKRGGTAGIAEMIGNELTTLGHRTTVTPARDVHSLDDVDAVIIAGALYAARWHRDARLLVRRHTDKLRQLPVWLVASGPLDDSALTGNLRPAGHVARAAARIGARGQITFGGRLTPDATGFPAAAMAKKHSGDWRNFEQIKAWTAGVAANLAPPGGRSAESDTAANPGAGPP